MNTYPKGRTALIKLREDLVMELLWTQQAIDSRKKVSVISQKKIVNSEQYNHIKPSKLSMDQTMVNGDAKIKKLTQHTPGSLVIHLYNQLLYYLSLHIFGLFSWGSKPLF